MKPLILAIYPKSSDEIQVLSFTEASSAYFERCVDLYDTVDYVVAEVSSFLKPALALLEAKDG